MTKLSRIELEIRREIPATLEGIEELVADVRRQSETLLDRSAGFACELLVREALTNAVVHGCRSDAAKRVSCRLRLKARRLVLQIADPGEGFNWRAPSGDSLPAPRCSGRGIEILRKYAERVRYNSRGNTVTLVRRFS